MIRDRFTWNKEGHKHRCMFHVEHAHALDAALHHLCLWENRRPFLNLS